VLVSRISVFITFRPLLLKLLHFHIVSCVRYLISLRRCRDNRGADLLPGMPADVRLTFERGVFGVEDFLVLALVLGYCRYFLVDFWGEH